MIPTAAQNRPTAVSERQYLTGSRLDRTGKRVSPRPKLREYSGYPGYLYRPAAPPSAQDPVAEVVDMEGNC